MRKVFIFSFIVAGIIIGGPSSFAKTNQFTDYIFSGLTESAKISYLHGPYNTTFFESRNEAHHLGLGFMYLLPYEYRDTKLRSSITKALEKSFLLYQLYRLYLNEDWRRKAAQTIDEYSRLDVATLSYNHLITSDTMLFTGLLHNKEMVIKSQTNNTIVLGIYHQLTP